MQFEFLINRYEERLSNVADSLEKLMNIEGKGERDKRQIEEWFNMQAKSIKDRCVEEVSKTRRDMNDFIQNEKAT